MSRLRITRDLATGGVVLHHPAFEGSGALVLDAEEWVRMVAGVSAITDEQEALDAAAMVHHGRCSIDIALGGEVIARIALQQARSQLQVPLAVVPASVLPLRP